MALLGLRHATDPDHLAAVTSLVAGGRERATRAAAKLGLCWGLGHATTDVKKPSPSADGPVSRMLVRVRRDSGLELAAALRRSTGVLSARRDQQPVRVQIDPLHIG